MSVPSQANPFPSNSMALSMAWMNSTFPSLSSRKCCGNHRILKHVMAVLSWHPWWRRASDLESSRFLLYSTNHVKILFSAAPNTPRSTLEKAFSSTNFEDLDWSRRTLWSYIEYFSSREKKPGTAFNPSLKYANWSRLFLQISLHMISWISWSRFCNDTGQLKFHWVEFRTSNINGSSTTSSSSMSDMCCLNTTCSCW